MKRYNKNSINSLKRVSKEFQESITRASKEHQKKWRKNTLQNKLKIKQNEFKKTKHDESITITMKANIYPQHALSGTKTYNHSNTKAKVGGRA